MKYTFTKRSFKTYLKYVRRPAKQCASGSCVIAQFIERIGGKEPRVCSWDASATFGGKFKNWHMPTWAQAAINAFDGMNGGQRSDRTYERWIPAKAYKRVLSVI